MVWYLYIFVNDLQVWYSTVPVHIYKVISTLKYGTVRYLYILIKWPLHVVQYCTVLISKLIQNSYLEFSGNFSIEKLKALLREKSQGDRIVHWHVDHSCLETLFGMADENLLWAEELCHLLLFPTVATSLMPLFE